MDDLTRQLKSQAARLVKQLLRRMLLKLVKALLVKTAAVWVPVLVAVLLAAFVWLFLFEMPKTAIRDTASSLTDRVSAFFFGAKDAPAEDIYAVYEQTAARWNEKLTDEQKVQVTPYVLTAEWLAQVDRTLRDPAFRSLYTGTETKELEPDPEGTFSKVRPKFTWEKAETVTQLERCNCRTVGTGENARTVCDRGSDTERKTVTLLGLARTMEASFAYRYKTVTSSSSSPSSCGSLTTTVTEKQLEAIDTTDGEWEPLRKLLIAEGVTRAQDQDFLMEYWLGYLYDSHTGGLLPEASWSPVAGGGWRWPLPQKGTLTSGFTRRINPVTGIEELHTGVDIAVAKGTPVLGARDGTVIYAGPMGTAGNAIIVKHDDRTESRYYHLSAVTAAQGQTVRAGEEVGKAGSTGNSTGVHLHFEIRLSGLPVDPLIYFTASPGEGQQVAVTATGYTADFESTGKNKGDPGWGITYSGLPVVRDSKGLSTIAADPSVFPIGTLLLIPGYGYGVVADTGSAIKGNRIDLYFETREQVYSEWGKRDVSVTVLKQGTGQLDAALWKALQKQIAG